VCVVILSDRWDDEAAQITLLLLFTTEEAEDVETETTDAEACNAFVNIFFLSPSLLALYVLYVRVCEFVRCVFYLSQQRKLIYFPEEGRVLDDAIFHLHEFT